MIPKPSPRSTADNFEDDALSDLHLHVPMYDGLPLSEDTLQALAFLTPGIRSEEGDIVAIKCDFDRESMRTRSTGLLVMQNRRLIVARRDELPSKLLSKAAIAYMAVQEDPVLPVFIDSLLPRSDHRVHHGVVTAAGAAVHNPTLNLGTLGKTSYIDAQKAVDMLDYHAFLCRSSSQHDALQKRSNLDWLVADQVTFGQVARHTTLQDKNLPESFKVRLVPRDKPDR